MARVWNTPIFAIAAIYFAVDALFSGHGTDHRMAQQKEAAGTGSALGNVVGALSVLRSICGARRHIGAS
jgi:hypothetical protein